MKFKIYYTKSGNQFFFISNLAEWHFSCREKYNEEWIKRTGALTVKEKKVLKIFKKILKKYDFREKDGKRLYLGIPFITSPDKKIWATVKKWVNKEEFKKIKQVFEIFNKRFNKIWLNSKKEMGITKKLLSCNLNKKREIKNILKYFSILYQKEVDNKLLIKIYLFHHPINNPFLFSGGANLNKDELTFECSKIIFNTSSEEKAIRLILHELIHCYFEESRFRKLLKNYLDKIDSKKFTNTAVFKETKSIKIIINEMIVDSMMPNGYLAEKYFHFKVKKKFKNIKEIENKKNKLLADYRKLATYHLYPVLKKYLSKRKPLDENYIKKTVKIFFKYQ